MKTFLVVQWVKDFKLPLLGEVGVGSIPGQEAKILAAAQPKNYFKNFFKVIKNEN